MAKLVINGFIRDFVPNNPKPEEGSVLDIDASDVRSLIKQLGALYPGIENSLQHNCAVAIDGEIFADALFEELEKDSEVFFLPPIEGG